LHYTLRKVLFYEQKRFLKIKVHPETGPPQSNLFVWKMVKHIEIFQKFIYGIDAKHTYIEIFQRLIYKIDAKFRKINVRKIETQMKL